ncbi:thioesterase family protein [Paraburkholderia sp. USG1]|uniref:acyl-CoA thioesterase n=1 Tax=Paraburkholderia sp. USG1 TaxID=2952268 RepID=UPI0028673C91|nr:acyl-CoA thioesterase domain-containing protein [Paraburkholderia sp. USG1]MDR8394735.1 thioesterase family protein [Paraburkholderia sp. USG1]
MSEPNRLLPPWNEADLAELLTLEKSATGRYRSCLCDPNLNGRVYGGQLLGQAMAAAALTVPEDRAATAMQLLFLQGAMPDQPIDFEVIALQDGKRFSSRHVRGSQGGTRFILDAHVTFALPLSAPEHATPSSALEQDPDALPAFSTQACDWEERLRRLGGYSLREKPCIEFRVPDFERQMAPDAARSGLRFWIKTRDQLSASPGIHAGAFAYLSDWWLNFSSLGPHLHALSEQRNLYIASLNHSIWFHQPVAADQWMHFHSRSPCAASGRGLSVAEVHDRRGRLVASVTQECLMAYAD